MSGKRKLYTEERARAMFARMRDDLHNMHSRHVSELFALRRELDECRAVLAELRSATLSPQRAEAELAALHRERAVALAQAAERDLSQPLQ